MTMTPEAIRVPPATTYLGGVRFVSQSRFDETRRALETEGLLVVDCGPWEGSARGRLGFTLDDAVERTLLAHGACPAGVGPASDLQAALGDQLYRARLLGAHGIGLIIESLGAIATLSSVLDGEDSAALRWWLRASRDRPICVVLDDRDRDLGIYESPVFLSRVVASLETGLSPTPRPQSASPLEPLTYLSESEPTPRSPIVTLSEENRIPYAIAATESTEDSTPLARDSDFVDCTGEAASHAPAEFVEEPQNHVPAGLVEDSIDNHPLNDIDCDARSAHESDFVDGTSEPTRDTPAGGGARRRLHQPYRRQSQRRVHQPRTGRARE
jgi:hypothetical protein